MLIGEVRLPGPTYVGVNECFDEVLRCQGVREEQVHHVAVDIVSSSDARDAWGHHKDELPMNNAISNSITARPLHTGKSK